MFTVKKTYRYNKFFNIFTKKTRKNNSFRLIAVQAAGRSLNRAGRRLSFRLIHSTFIQTHRNSKGDKNIT